MSRSFKTKAQQPFHQHLKDRTWIVVPHGPGSLQWVQVRELWVSRFTRSGIACCWGLVGWCVSLCFCWGQIKTKWGSGAGGRGQKLAQSKSRTSGSPAHQANLLWKSREVGSIHLRSVALAQLRQPGGSPLELRLRLVDQTLRPKWNLKGYNPCGRVGARVEAEVCEAVRFSRPRYESMAFRNSAALGSFVQC